MKERAVAKAALFLLSLIYEYKNDTISVSENVRFGSMGVELTGRVRRKTHYYEWRVSG